MTDFNFTVGSRWMSKGAGVGVVSHDDGTEDYPIKIDFEHGSSWYSRQGKIILKNPSHLEITGPADQPVKTDDGWIEWSGGECPVLKGTRIDVQFRDSQKRFNVPALQYVDGLHDTTWAHWVNDDDNIDITAYRPHQPAKPVEDAPVTGDDQRAWDELIAAKGWIFTINQAQAPLVPDKQIPIYDTILRVLADALAAERAKRMKGEG